MNSSSDIDCASRTFCLIRACALRGPAAISRAHAIAASRSSSSGTTRLTSPHCCAVSASMRGLSSMTSSAFDGPSIRVKNHVVAKSPLNASAM